MTPSLPWGRHLARDAQSRRPTNEADRRATPPAGRRRVARPLIGRRLPSGRRATEQPNASGDGPAALTPLFWLLLAATGVATGLFGALLMFVLHSVQHLAFAYIGGTFQSAVERASPRRRVAVLALAGAFAGVVWFFLRRWTRGEKAEVHGTLWAGETDLSFRRSLATSLFSEVIVGMGASLGREAAPQLMGAVSGSLLGRWARLSPAQRRLLLACGAGAGLAAVYNVPLGGALVVAEILYGQIALPVALPALACAGIATAVSWVYLPARPTYTGVPPYAFDVPQLAWALLVGPLIGLVAVGWTRLVGWVQSRRPSGRLLLVAPLGAFVLLGVVGVVYPQLFGNGKDMAHDAFLGRWGLPLLLALFALKPLVTALCLGSGATGGLFTPTLSTGAMLGGVLGILWSLLWPGAPLGSYALIGASAMIGAAMQAPLAGLALVFELTGTTFGVAVPMIAATALATAVARYLDGYSIYSARLPSRGA